MAFFWFILNVLSTTRDNEAHRLLPALPKIAVRRQQMHDSFTNVIIADLYNRFDFMGLTSVQSQQTEEVGCDLMTRERTKAFRKSSKNQGTLGSFLGRIWHLTGLPFPLRRRPGLFQKNEPLDINNNILLRLSLPGSLEGMNNNRPLPQL